MELKTSIFLVLTLYVLSLALAVASWPHGTHLTSHRHHSSHHQQHHSRSRHRSYSDNDSRTYISNNNNHHNNKDNEEGRGMGSSERDPGIVARPAAATAMKRGRAKPWRRVPQDDDYYDDDDGGRHSYLMTTNKKDTTETRDEDEAINSAFEKHMRPHQQHHHHSQDNHQDLTNTNSNAKDNSKTSEQQQPQLPEHDVYAYQLPSNLWFIVRYAQDSEGHMEKYMNIVDSFTNYLDKLTEGVRTVSVNVKGVETVFRLTAKHKPYHSQSGTTSSES